MSKYSGKHWRYGFAEGTAFGTPVADAGAFHEMNCDHFDIDPDIKHHNPPRAIGQLEPDKSALWNDVLGSLVKAAPKGIALKEELDFWLYLLFQNVSEGATTPFQKTFTFPAVGPVFADDEGEFITLISRAPAAALSEKASSLIATKLDLSLSPDANDACLFYEASLMGKGFARDSDPSGTWTPTTDGASHRFGYHNIQACTLGGSAFSLETFKLSLEVPYKQQGSDGAGSFSDLGMIGQNGSLQIVGLWDTVGQSGLAALDAGSEIDFVLTWGTVAQDGYLNIAFKGMVQPGSKIDKGDLAMVNLTLKGMTDKANTEEMVTIDLANAVQRSW